MVYTVLILFVLSGLFLLIEPIVFNIGLKRKLNKKRNEIVVKVIESYYKPLVKNIKYENMFLSYDELKFNDESIVK